jgi:hypothetical protein
MATMSTNGQRRFAGFAMLLLLVTLCCAGRAAGQGTPLVVASSPAGINHPTGWGLIQQSAIDSMGDWFVVDYANGSVYEFPANGGAVLSISGVAGLGGGYENPAIAIDPNNNIYLGANWNNGIVMFPYVAATNSWTGLSTLSPSNPTIDFCTNSGKNNLAQCWAQYGLSAPGASGFPGYFQPWGLAIGANNTLLVGNQNSGNFIYSLSVNGAWANPTAGPITSEAINTMAKRPISVAQDPESNIYFVEDTGGVAGLSEIPAGTAELSADTGLPRVDPTLPAVSGVTLDSSGNIYVSDATDGVFYIPNPAGTPQTASAVELTPVPAVGEVAIDWTRNIMYVPTNQAQTNSQADVSKVQFGYAELGSATPGSSSANNTQGWASFAFNGSVTPASFKIVEAGVANGDFSVGAGNCNLGTAYAASSGCTAIVTFTPKSVGSISAKLLMLDATSNVLASLVLHGTGLGSTVQASPAVQSAIGSKLMTPAQVAIDAGGNVYVADPGQGKVLKYSAGSGASATGVSIGTGLTAPTGVAVDGAGDIFIGDSGSVYEVPYGPSGLNAAGQTTLVSGLAANLNLAVDGQGDLYIADPSDKQVVKFSNIGGLAVIGAQKETMLTAGFSAPSAVAVDSNGNLYVVDGANLFEVAGGLGAPAALLNNLAGVTGLAVDPSGAVYISSATGTSRIPSIGGILVPADETAIAATASNTSSVALDNLGNVYLSQASGGSITFVGTNSALVVPTPTSLTSSTQATATVTNAGNAPLTVTGYTSTNSVDFAGSDATSGGCVAGSPVTVGASCLVNIAFNPGAGEQGALSSTIGVTSNANNGPLTISAVSTGLTLSGSLTSGTAGNTSQVINTPLSLTVGPKGGTGSSPTGTVTVTFPTWTVSVPNPCGQTGQPACAPAIMPTTSTMTAQLVNGAASLNLSPVLAGTQTITVAYSGDRTYGRSTGSITTNIAKSQVSAIALPTIPDPTDINLPFVLEQDGSTPYDGSQTPWQYQFKINVNTAAGIPTGTITLMDNSSACPPGTSATGIGAATCALTGLNGVACPQSSGDGVLTIANAGNSPTGAGVQFSAACLPMPQNTTYTPIISTHYITPVYSGDANFLTFNGASTVLQSVRSPVVQITTSSPSSLTTAPTLSVPSGGSASLNLTLSSILGYGIAGRGGQLNDYNFPVSLSCDNLPPHAVCTFNYPNPDPSISTAVDIPCPSGATTSQVAAGTANCTPGLATVTINTNVSVGTTTSQNVLVSSVTLASIFGVGMLGLFFRRKAFEKGRYLMILILTLVGGGVAMSITACNTTNLAPLAKLSTPTGTYAVTITAQQVGTQTISLPTGPVQVYGSQNQVSLPFYINVTIQ